MMTVTTGLHSTPPPALPSTSQLQSYLRFKGWHQLSPGPAGSLWVNDTARIGVPYDDDEFLIEGAIERVAKAEQRSPKEVRDAVRFLLYDVTYLRAVNDHVIAETIPLGAAATILTSSKRMLQATATTARSERAQIGGNFSKLGNDVVKHALMGHTERGSFVIPVLVELPEPSPVDLHEMDLVEELSEGRFHRSAPEPFERRVVRTFAQSMQAIQEVVVDPSKDPTVDQIYELVYRGVSREFCTSLTGILNEPSVAEFGATIDWAPVITPPRTLSGRISIDAGAADLVQRVANRLRQTKVDPSQVFSGTIVQLRHEDPQDPYGEIAVTTVRHGHQSEVLVRLPLNQYENAWEWHYQGRAVLVEGVVRSAPGQRLRVDSPTRFLPVDETLLPMGNGETA
jgi:hypothetical protein